MAFPADMEGKTFFHLAFHLSPKILNSGLPTGVYRREPCPIRAQHAERHLLISVALELEAVGLGPGHDFDAEERRNFLRGGRPINIPEEPDCQAKASPRALFDRLWRWLGFAHRQPKGEVSTLRSVLPWRENLKYSTEMITLQLQ